MDDDGRTDGCRTMGILLAHLKHFNKLRFRVPNTTSFLTIGPLGPTISEGSDVVSVSCFGVRVSVIFHFMFVYFTFSSVWVAEWPPFGK